MKFPEPWAKVDRAEMARHVMNNADFCDLCEDAKMLEVLQYIYGSRSLNLPYEWKEAIRSILYGDWEL